MNKTQKLLILLSVLLMFIAHLIMSYYFERHYCLLDNAQIHLPVPTYYVLQWRSWWVWLPFILPLIAFLFKGNSKNFGTILLLGTLISTPTLLGLTVWSVMLPYYPLGN